MENVTFKCDVCGSDLIAKKHSCYPGTSDIVYTFEPCCAPEEIQDDLPEK